MKTKTYFCNYNKVGQKERNGITMKKDVKRLLVFTIILSMVFSWMRGKDNVVDAGNITVTATGTQLREGQTLTKAMVKKVVTVRKNGKKTKAYICSNVGKIITRNSNGTYRLTLKIATKTKKVAIKVNPIKKIYLKKTALTLTEGQKFSSSTFKKKTQIYAKYKTGADKALTTYSVSAAKTVKANSKGKFVVTVKSGKLSLKVSVPVKKPVTPTPTATETPKPTEVPEITATVTPTPKPTAVPKVTDTPVPTDTPTATVPTVVTPVPTDEATAVPQVTDTPVPTDTPTATVPSVVTPEPTDGTTEVPQVTNTPVPTEVPTATVPTTLGPAPTIQVIVVPYPYPVYITPTPVPTQTPTPKPTATQVPTATPVPTATAPTTPTQTPVPEFTLTVTSNGNTVKVNGRETAGTETATDGTEVSLSTTDSSNFRFVRWINVTTGAELSTSKTYTFTVKSNMTIKAVFEQVYTVTVKRVGGKGKVSIAGESLDFYDNVATFTNVPGKYKLVATGTDDYQFVSLVNGSNVILSRVPEYSFSISGDIELTVNFAEVEKTVTVTYRYESGGTIFKSEAVTFGEKLIPPTENVWREGKNFNGWKIGEDLFSGEIGDADFYCGSRSLSEAIKELTGQKKSVEIIASYEVTPITYTVTVENGKLLNSEGNQISNNVLAGAYVYAVANTIPEKIFQCWKNSNGDIVSYNESYDFYVTSNMTLIAVYGDVPVKKEPIVAFRGEEYVVSVENSSITFLTTIDLPNGYENLEWGILLSTKTNNIDINTSGLWKIQDTDPKVITSKYADSSITATQTAMFTNHKTVYARLYAKISSTENGTEVIYSKVITIQL